MYLNPTGGLEVCMHLFPPSSMSSVKMPLHVESLCQMQHFCNVSEVLLPQLLSAASQVC